MDIKILDCTLRDGGYYNKWDFDLGLTEKYLAVMAGVGVDYVELGLRQIKKSQFLGANAYTTDSFLSRLSLPDGPIYGVMIDAKNILSQNINQADCIDKLFKSSVEERIGLVRVAASYLEAPQCESMLKALKEKGYEVGFNIMQASLRDSDELTHLAKQISSWKCVDVLYFADSLGSMEIADVERVYNAMRSGWLKELGFHAHNNMGQGISNVKMAIKLGCTWIDGTVTGMGRGAGNAELEYIVEQPEISPKMKDTQQLMSLVMNYFEPLKKKYGWGMSMAYHYSARKGIHPMFVQDLCSDESLDTEHLPKILNDLSRLEFPNIYNRNILASVLSKTVDDDVVLGVEVAPIFAGQEIVLVAQTAVSKKYQAAIKDYVAAKDVVLIAINLPSKDIDLDYDFVVISHNQKFRDEESSYNDSNYKYIGPAKLFESSEVAVTHDYGVLVEKDQFKAFSNYACVPNRLTLSYAVAFCLAAQAETISLVGFGGYASENPKQKEMQEFLALLRVMEVNLRSLTPTSYSLSEISIYNI